MINEITNGTKYPPDKWQSWFERFEEYAAWYSGDPTEIMNFYSQMIHNINGKFWGMHERKERATVVHIPIANDLAEVSSNLLFSELPQAAFGKDKDRLKELFDQTNFITLCSESAEIASAMSGVLLKLDVDTTISQYPICSSVSPKGFIPQFYRGFLVAVQFFSAVLIEHSDVYRLVEKREVINGTLVIRCELYKGDASSFGRRMPLDAIPETNGIAAYTEVPVNVLGCVYIPNKRPNLISPGNPMGVSDYHNVLTMMDSLDEVWTSWIRDVRLSKSRLFVDGSLLDFEKRFSVDQELFQEIDLSDAQLQANGNVDPLRMVQFAIRAEEHYKTAETLSKEIISRAGYSPQTFGYDMKTYTESGAALRVKERKSLMTRQTKERYWNYGLKQFIYQLQVFANLISEDYTPEVPTLTFADSVVPDISVTAQSIASLRASGTISLYQSVKEIHPEWEDSFVMEEVSRIEKEAEEKAKVIVNKKLEGMIPPEGENEND